MEKHWSPRSGRQRMVLKAVARSAGSILFLFRDPGARAPGFTLSLASRANAWLCPRYWSELFT